MTSCGVTDQSSKTGLHTVMANDELCLQQILVPPLHVENRVYQFTIILLYEGVAAAVHDTVSGPTTTTKRTGKLGNISIFSLAYWC